MGAAGSTVAHKGEVLDVIKTLETVDNHDNRELFQKRNKIDTIGEIVSNDDKVLNGVAGNSNNVSDKDKDDIDDTTSVLSYGDMGEDDLIENDLNEDIDILDTSMQSISSVKSAGNDTINQNDKYSELGATVVKGKVDVPTIQISKENNNNYAQTSPPSKKSSPITTTSPTHRSPAHSISSIESTDAGMDTDISDTDNYMDNRVSKLSQSAAKHKVKAGQEATADSSADRNIPKFSKKLSVETSANSNNYRVTMPLSPIKESAPLSPINALVTKQAISTAAVIPTADSPTSQAVRAIVDGSTAFLFDLEDSNDSNLSINSKSPTSNTTYSINDKQQIPHNNKQRKKSDSRALSNNGFYMDYSQKIEEKNSSLLGLQRQKIWSYAQNAQLEREVELLQKQLEQIEQMEKELDKKENKNKNIPRQQQQHQPQRQHQSPNAVPFKYAPSIGSNDAKSDVIIPINTMVVKNNDPNGHSVTTANTASSHVSKNKVLIRSNPHSKDLMKESDDETDTLLQEFGLGNYDNNNKDYPLAISLNDYYVGADNKQLGYDKHYLNDGGSKKKLNARGSKAIDDRINKINSNSVRSSNLTSEEEMNIAIAAACESDTKESKPDSFNSNAPAQFKKNKNKNILKNLNRRRRTLDGQLSDTGNDSVTEDEDKGGGTDSEYYVTTEPVHPNNNHENNLVDLKHVNDSPENIVAVKKKRRPRMKEVAEPKLVVTESASTLPDSKQENNNANNNISSSILAIKKKEREFKAMGDSGVDQRKNKLWTRALDSRWSEVNLLLRRKIDCQEDIQYVVAAAEAGLMFTDQLTNVAKSLNVLRGTLSRWLLPYDNNTRIDEQCSTPHSVVENMPDGLRGRISERQVHYLVAGANSVRKLIRIKIADDNDLDQARQALKTAVDFFRRLQEEATKNNMTQFELLSLRDK